MLVKARACAGVKLVVVLLIIADNKAEVKSKGNPGIAAAGIDRSCAEASAVSAAVDKPVRFAEDSPAN